MQPKKVPAKEKTGLHLRNKHRERYEFGPLIQSCPELAPFVRINPYGDESIDFFNPEAVKMLNKALLLHYYNLGYWDIPNGYLCPPIPGRADYLHRMADLLAEGNHGIVPLGDQVRCLDIGVGANCIYPILGNSSYGWSFVGSELDAVAIQSANEIVRRNPSLGNSITIRVQKEPSSIFAGIVQPSEYFDLSICNPPFHTSAEEANRGSQKKISHLGRDKSKGTMLNFGGQSHELWCDGGELKFVRQMVKESRMWASSIGWFSVLVSKSINLPQIYHALKQEGAATVRTIPMSHGNKSSRIVAWKFKHQETDGMVK
jgi:23S rRNA (adenine1618-N6)-methyltransferase